MQEEKLKNGVVNHFEEGSNCQVFNGDITGCVFAMPGSNVNHYGGKEEKGSTEDNASTTEEGCTASIGEDEELCRFIHPTVDNRSQEIQIHNEVKRLVRSQGVKDICSYLQVMKADKKILLPESPSKAYQEMVRMGMPSGEGFNEKTFQKYYKK